MNRDDDDEVDAEIIAAVDLGSNSFHMVVARVVDGHPVIVDRLRTHVALGAGLDEDDNLGPEARGRALAALERFGDRLKDVTGPGVRAVGTQTLRRARNASSFLQEAEVALGHPIEIIAGEEEARLIYLGVCHSRATGDTERRLVVDIGGGSTELILGTGFQPEWMRSTQMGCVSYTKRFFPDGTFKQKRMDAARLAARIETRPIAKRIRGAAWDSAIGASGTIRNVQRILHVNGWCERGITRDGLQTLEEELLRARTPKAAAAAIEGLKTERAHSIAGGLMILSALFEGMQIESMEAALGALREGVLFDLLGRMRHEDVRNRSIRIMEERYHVDGEQAKRVEQTALALLDAVADAWKLDHARGARFLSWASRLHEIGLAVSYAGHQRHGAYLVANSELAGFSQDDRGLLAAIINGQRAKTSIDDFANLPPRSAALAPALVALLRIAIRLHRGRSWDDIPDWTVEGGRDRSVSLHFPEGWLREHPLTRGDLDKERSRIEALGIQVNLPIPN